MPAKKTIIHGGVEIEVWDQSFRCSPRGGSSPWWLMRDIDATDIESIKRVINAGRAAMAEDIYRLRAQEERFMGER